MDITQRANDLRFKILSILNDKEEEDGVELLREFESALAEERQQQSLNHPYVFTDSRAKAIASAHYQLELINAAAHHTNDPDGHAASLKDAIAAKEGAYAMREHEYECMFCKETFQSPARMVLVLSGFVDHDTDGGVTSAKIFHKQAHLIACSNCKQIFNLEAYLSKAS